MYAIRSYYEGTLTTEGLLDAHVIFWFVAPVGVTPSVNSATAPVLMLTGLEVIVLIPSKGKSRFPTRVKTILSKFHCHAPSEPTLRNNFV